MNCSIIEMGRPGYCLALKARHEPWCFKRREKLTRVQRKSSSGFIGELIVWLEMFLVPISLVAGITLAVEGIHQSYAWHYERFSIGFFAYWTMWKDQTKFYSVPQVLWCHHDIFTSAQSNDLLHCQQQSTRRTSIAVVFSVHDPTEAKRTWITCYFFKFR